MCRLFAYVHSGSSVSMREALGPLVLDGFCQLSEVHRDGWGAAWRRAGALSLYTSTRSSATDGTMFGAVTAQTIDSAIIHERWASPGIALALENQHPFAVDGLVFAHNGTIANAEGNIVRRPASYRQSLGLTTSTTQSDSRLYAELFALRLRELHPNREGAPTPGEVCQALSATLAQLRRDYPEAGFNNLIETPDFTFATRAHGDNPVHSAGLRRGYEQAGWTHRLDSYYDLMYTTLTHDDGAVTSVVSSSGYPGSDPWSVVKNNTLLVLSHRDASVSVLPLLD